MKSSLFILVFLIGLSVGWLVFHKTATKPSVYINMRDGSMLIRYPHGYEYKVKTAFSLALDNPPGIDDWKELNSPSTVTTAHGIVGNFAQDVSNMSLYITVDNMAAIKAPARDYMRTFVGDDMENRSSGEAKRRFVDQAIESAGQRRAEDVAP